MTSSDGSHNQQVIEEFRSHRGAVGGYYATIPLLLLTTTGARTARRRTVPLAYLADGDRYAIVVAHAGSATNPAWYHNLINQPDVTVEIRDDTFDATAAVAEGQRRADLIDRFTAQQPQLASYQRRTNRPIPVVVLTPRRRLLGRDRSAGRAGQRHAVSAFPHALGSH